MVVAVSHKGREDREGERRARPDSWRQVRP